MKSKNQWKKNTAMVKKTLKQPEKKAPPKPKLIEGQYSHKFLTRLLPPQGERLVKLMQSSGKGTYNGTIVYIIDRYEDTIKQLNDIKNELHTSYADAERRERAVTQFKRCRISQISARRRRCFDNKTTCSCRTRYLILITI